MLLGLLFGCFLALPIKGPFLEYFCTFSRVLKQIQVARHDLICLVLFNTSLAKSAVIF